MNDMIKKQWEMTQSRFKQLDNEDLTDKIKEAYIELEKKDFHGCFDFEDDVYHQGIGLANGQIGQVDTSPLKHHYNTYVDPHIEKSDPLLIGSLVHTAILEPMRLQEKYVSEEAILIKVGGKSPRSTKEYKNYKEEVEESGKFLIKIHDFEMCVKMVKNIYNHPKLKNVLAKGMMENCVYAVDKNTGLLLRCKPDRVVPEIGEILDVKSTKDASLEEFQKSIWNFKYYIGAAFYLYVCSLAFKKEFTTYMWGCLEKQKPYDVVAYYADIACLEMGEIAARKNIDKYAECLTTGKWPGYPQDIQPISLPHWAFAKEN